MDDEGDPLAHIQGLEQGVEVAAVLDEAIRTGATVRQLVGVAHADQVGSDAAASWLQVRQHVAPEVRRGGIAVQQHDGIALSHLHVRHLAAEDPLPLLSVRKLGRDHIGFSFFLCSSRQPSFEWDSFFRAEGWRGWLQPDTEERERFGGSRRAAKVDHAIERRVEKEDTTTSGTCSCARRSPSPMHPPPHALEKKSATRLLVTELLARGSKTGARVNRP